VKMVAFTRADAGMLLARALVADAARHGLSVATRDWRSHPWASATFVGHRHVATLVVEGDAAAWLAALPEAEFSLRGHIVADLVAARAGDGQIAVHALTLDYA